MTITPLISLIDPSQSQQSPPFELLQQELKTLYEEVERESETWTHKELGLQVRVSLKLHTQLILLELKRLQREGFAEPKLQDLANRLKAKTTHCLEQARHQECQFVLKQQAMSEGLRSVMRRMRTAPQHTVTTGLQHSPTDQIVSSTTNAIVATALHHLPFATTGQFVYATATHSNHGVVEAVSAGAAHVFLDTCVEVAFSAIGAEIPLIIEESLAGSLLSKIIPHGSAGTTISLVLTAHIVRAVAESGVATLPSGDLTPVYIPTGVGGDDTPWTAGELRALARVYSLPAVALDAFSHACTHALQSGLHAVGVTDEDIQHCINRVLTFFKRSGAPPVATDIWGYCD